MNAAALKDIALNYLWLVCFAVGGLGAIISWVAFPHDRDKASLLQYLVFISVFIVLLAGVSFFPNKNQLLYLLILIPILILNLYLAPKLSFFALSNLYPQYYTMFYSVLYPMVLASICFAYRIGGGTPGNSLKIGIIGVLVLFSGAVDLMWFVLSGLDYTTHATSIPHVEVVIGHMPSLFEILVFISVHFLLAIGVLFLPIDQMLMNLNPALLEG
jgi:hypothetical protein